MCNLEWGPSKCAPDQKRVVKVHECPDLETCPMLLYIMPADVIKENSEEWRVLVGSMKRIVAMTDGELWKYKSWANASPTL